MDNLTNNKKTLTLILVLLILVFFVLIYLTFFKRPGNTVSKPTPSPTIVQNNPYSEGSLTQDYNRIKNTKALSVTDEAVRQKLLRQIGSKSGNIKRTDTYSVDYVATANQFMVEINSPDNADQAKKDSEAWFIQQGLSQQGICNLPVVYFLGGFTLQTYKQQNKQFNPIPDGC